MSKSSSIFRKKGTHCGKKKFEKYKDCPLLKFESFEHAIFFCFVSRFEHVNFAINEKYSKKIMTIQTIMFHLWSFKHTKMHF